MKRGPEPVKGFDAAIPAALRRGRVIRFRSSPEYVGSFLFYGNGLLVLVCLRLAVRLSRATLAEISADYAGAIAGLCMIPCGGPVSRELWLYTRHGMLRFFRVGGNGGLEEIDRDGVPFVDGKPVSLVMPATGAAGAAAPVPAGGVPAGSGGADPPNHVLRWLAKRNAVKARAAEEKGVTGTHVPGKSPGSSGREPENSGIVPIVGTVPSSDSQPGDGISSDIMARDSLPGEPGSSPNPREEGDGAGG
jgi:hypothetical protein